RKRDGQTEPTHAQRLPAWGPRITARTTWKAPDYNYILSRRVGLMIRRKRFVVLGMLGTVVVALAVLASTGFAARSASSSVQPGHIDCEYSGLCPDLANPQDVFGDEYVGHDEPSLLFYSDTPGSGNHMRYNMTLPTDPPASNPSKRSYSFELNGA